MDAWRQYGMRGDARGHSLKYLTQVAEASAPPVILTEM